MRKNKFRYIALGLVIALVVSMGFVRKIERNRNIYAHSRANEINIISREAAAEKAVSKAGGDAVLVSIELDRDDRRSVYEGEIRDGRKEYEFEIDAVSGKFIKWEKEFDDMFWK